LKPNLWPASGPSNICNFPSNSSITHKHCAMTFTCQPIYPGCYNYIMLLYGISKSCTFPLPGKISFLKTQLSPEINATFSKGTYWVRFLLVFCPPNPILLWFTFIQDTTFLYMVGLHIFFLKSFSLQNSENQSLVKYRSTVLDKCSHHCICYLLTSCFLSTFIQR
jgi:hypothetical protein